MQILKAVNRVGFFYCSSLVFSSCFISFCKSNNNTDFHFSWSLHSRALRWDLFYGYLLFKFRVGWWFLENWLWFLLEFDQWKLLKILTVALFLNLKTFLNLFWLFKFQNISSNLNPFHKMSKKRCDFRENISQFFK